MNTVRYICLCFIVAYTRTYQVHQSSSDSMLPMLFVLKSILRACSISKRSRSMSWSPVSVWPAPAPPASALGRPPWTWPRPVPPGAPTPPAGQALRWNSSIHTQEVVFSVADPEFLFRIPHPDFLYILDSGSNNSTKRGRQILFVLTFAATNTIKL